MKLKHLFAGSEVRSYDVPETATKERKLLANYVGGFQRGSGWGYRLVGTTEEFERLGAVRRDDRCFELFMDEFAIGWIIFCEVSP